MLRRNQRLRKEYLYRKGLEGKERATYERKRIMRKALEGELAWRCDHGVGLPGSHALTGRACYMWLAECMCM